MKTVAFVTRRHDVARDAFRDHYETLHAPLALPIVHTIGARLMRLVWYGIAVHRHREHGVVPVPLVEHSDRAGASSRSATTSWVRPTGSAS